MDASAELTEVLDDVLYGGLEQRIHGIWTHPQHPLRRPFNKIHTAKKKKKRLTNQCSVVLLVNSKQHYTSSVMQMTPNSICE